MSCIVYYLITGTLRLTFMTPILLILIDLTLFFDHLLYKYIIAADLHDP